MMPGVRFRALALLALGCEVIAPLRAGAQDSLSRRVVLSFAAGPSAHHFEGTGVGFVGSLRADVRVGPHVLAEPALGLYHYLPSGTGTRSYMLVEATAEFEAHAGAFRPFAGLGAGLANRSQNVGQEELWASVHAVGGVRLDIGPSWVARAEVRWRAMQIGTTTDVMFGLGLRL